ncbi:MAG: alpha/beta hydrolase [Dactylosporangium sp.]|nr:alpha/beta hydrolase [Dactylosporangium sp.]NNJ61382.1 alpha/beta hydrolase [Dactylosporangium sp.]
MRPTALFMAITVAVTAATTGLFPTTGYAEGSDPYPTCGAQSVAVTLSPSDPTVYTVAGRLCLRDNADRGMKTVELMLSGLTYDHNYFNLSYAPDRYSYVYAATNRGYSTFNIDRLGVGLSDKPPADLLTMQAHAYVTEQIIRKLRAGTIGGQAFSTVVGIGHSLGAGVLQRLAATTTDPAGAPDYLVLSGWLHAGNPPALATLGASLYEASADPTLAPLGLPSGYLTTRPGTRATNFYQLANAESTVISLDESLKQTGTTAERQTLIADRSTTLTLGIRVPVLLSVGALDTLQCATTADLSCATAADIIARESAYYGPQACLTAYSISGAGHSVNMHFNARTSYDSHHTWLDNYTVYQVNAKDANGCLPAP